MSLCALCRVIFLELIPGFALYRGFYEMGAYAFRATFSPGVSCLGQSVCCLIEMGRLLLLCRKETQPGDIVTRLQH